MANGADHKDHDSLIEIKTILLSFKEDTKEDLTDVKKSLTRQNGRIRKNEVKISWILGVGSAIVVVGGLIIKFFA